MYIHVPIHSTLAMLYSLYMYTLICALHSLVHFFELHLLAAMPHGKVDESISNFIRSSLNYERDYRYIYIHLHMEKGMHRANEANN